MKRTMPRYMAYALILFLGFFTACEKKIPEGTATFVKIAADAQSALARMQNGKLKVLHVGDKVEGYGNILTISDGRISIKGTEGEVILITLNNGNQNIQRIRKVVPQTGAPSATIMSTKDSSGASGMAVGRINEKPEPKK